LKVLRESFSLRSGKLMQETPNGFRAEIPPKRRKAAMVFVTGAIVFVVSVGRSVVNRATDSSQMFFPAAACTMIIGVSLFTLADELFGKGSIVLDGFMLTVTETTLGFKITRRFDITLMKNITIGASSYWQGSTYVMSEGCIHFEHEGRMVSIGGTIDQDEAFDVIGRIRKRQITPEKIG